jgi:hypothetical protein
MTTTPAPARTVPKFSKESQHILEAISREFIYFAPKASAYLVRSGVLMPKDGFIAYCDSHFGGLDFDPPQYDKNGAEQRVSAGAFWWAKSMERKRVVHSIVFEPGVHHDVSSGVFNTWDVLKNDMCAPDMRASVEAITPFVEHLGFVMGGDSVSVEFFMNWLAHLYQHPEDKLPASILMHSKYGGVGKTMLFEILSRVFGPSMVKSVPGHVLHDKFTDVIFGARVVMCNELAAADRRDSYEKFKSLVSEPNTVHEAKGRSARYVRNAAHFIITTNDDTALPLMRRDRRILVTSTDADPRPPSYYRDLVAWMKSPGPELLAGVLSRWRFPADWDAHAPVPHTEAAKAMHYNAAPSAVRYVRQLIDDHEPPFDRDFMPVRELQNALSLRHQAEFPHGIRDRDLAHVLKACDGVQKSAFKIGEKAHRVWIWRNRERWENASPAERTAHIGPLTHTMGGA